MTRSLPSLYANIWKQKQVRISFIASFIWGLAAHAYGFFSGALTHDCLNAFVATATEEVWKVELGRWFVPVYRAVFRSSVALPWLIGLLGLFWSAAAVCLAIRMLDISSAFDTVLVSGIMITNITYIAQIATYLYEFDINSFALFLAILAAFIWKQGRGALSILTGAFCFALCAGIYQSYISVTVVFIVLSFIIMLAEGRKAADAVLKLLNGGMLCGIGIGMYLAISALSCRIAGVELQGRVNIGTLLDSPGLLLSKTFGVYSHFFTNMLHPAYGIGWLKWLLWLNIFLILLALLAKLAAKAGPTANVLGIAAAMALLPIAADIIYPVAPGVHDLMTYGVWLGFVLLVMLRSKLFATPGVPSVLSKAARIVSALLVIILLWQNVIIANTAYTKKKLSADAAFGVMTRVVSMMEQQDGYEPGETPVTFIGSGAVYTSPEGFENIACITGLGHKSAIPTDTQTYFYNAYEAYFKYVLNYPVLFCEDSVHDRLKVSPETSGMPAFPQNGCMKYIDGVLVIKMG